MVCRSSKDEGARSRPHLSSLHYNSAMSSVPPRRRNYWPIALISLLMLVVVAFSVPWRLNFARDWIAERTQAATGRALRLEGDIWWHWGRLGRLEVNGLRFANPAWAGRPDM